MAVLQVPAADVVDLTASTASSSPSQPAAAAPAAPAAPPLSLTQSQPSLPLPLPASRMAALRELNTYEMQMDIDDARQQIEQMDRMLSAADDEDAATAYDYSLPIAAGPSSAAGAVKVIVSAASQQVAERCVANGWISIAADDRIYWWEAPRILVVDAAKDRLLAQRSMPYMKCLVLGFLIVDAAWLADSLTRRQLLPAADYEVRGCVGDTVPMAPLRGRCESRTEKGMLTLLKGCSFTVLEGRAHPSVGREDVEWLIVMVGGSLVSAAPAAVSAEDTVSVRHFSLALRLRARVAYAGPGPAVYSVSWLFDAVCNLRLPANPSVYLLPATVLS